MEIIKGVAKRKKTVQTKPHTVAVAAVACIAQPYSST